MSNYIGIMLQERCAGADTITLVAQLLHKSKTHLQSMLPRKNVALVEDFYVNMVSFCAIVLDHIPLHWYSIIHAIINLMQLLAFSLIG